MKSVENKQARNMVLITLAVIGATALITGVSTYFAFKPSTNSGNSGATAEIRNDVKIEEKIDHGTDVIQILGVIILIIIALVKIAELVIYFVNRCKSAIKKKYSRTTNAAATSTTPV